jgi:hypothetical protein
MLQFLLSIAYRQFIINGASRLGKIAAFIGSDLHRISKRVATLRRSIPLLSGTFHVLRAMILRQFGIERRSYGLIPADTKKSPLHQTFKTALIVPLINVGRLWLEVSSKIAKAEGESGRKRYLSFYSLGTSQ